MGWKRKTAYWIAVVLLLVALVLLARYDNWLQYYLSGDNIELLFFALIAFIEARLLGHFLREPLPRMLLLAAGAEIVSLLLGSILGGPMGPPFYWVLSYLARFDQDQHYEWEAVYWDTTSGFLMQLLIITALAVFFAILFKTPVYIIGLRESHNWRQVVPAVLAAIMISYPLVVLITLGLIWLFRVI